MWNMCGRTWRDRSRAFSDLVCRFPRKGVRSLPAHRWVDAVVSECHPESGHFSWFDGAENCRVQSPRHSVSLNRIVAIKRLNGEHDARFLQEAREIALLRKMNLT